MADDLTEGPEFPTSAYTLTPRDTGAVFVNAPVEPLREEQGPADPNAGGITGWLENQRAVAGTIGYDNPVVSAVRTAYDHFGLKRDASFDPWADIEGTEYVGNERFLKQAAFVGSKAELDILKKRFSEEEENDRLRSQNPVSAFLWGLAGAPFDPTNAIPGGAVYKAGKLGVGFAKSAAAGAAAGAVGGLVSEAAMQATHYTRGPEDFLTSAVYGGAFGGAIGLGASFLGEALGSAAAQMSKSEFTSLASKIDNGEVGFGGSASAAYRYEGDNRLKSTLGVAEVAGKTPVYGSPIAFVQTSPYAATRRAAEWVGDGRLSYEKNDLGVPTAVDQTTGIRGNLDDVKRGARAQHAEFGRALEDRYSEYRFGRQRRFGDAVRRAVPDPDHLDFDDFKAEAFMAANMADEHPIPEVAAAAKEFRKFADDLADRAVEMGIWDSKPQAVGALSYAPHMFNTKLVSARRQEFISDTAQFYTSDQEVKARLKTRAEEVQAEQLKIADVQRKLERRMETLDRQEKELSARGKERGMEVDRTGRRVDLLEGQATDAGEKATSLDEFVSAVKAEMTSPEARAQIDDLRAQAREMSRLAKPRTQTDIARSARFERDAVLSGVRLAAEIVIGRKRSYEPPSFLRWIARQGGVSDPNGTLKGSDISLRGVVAAKGRSFDQLGERIAEEAGGLLPGRPGANEVEDWIVNAARGEEPGWWVSRHFDDEHAGQSQVAAQIQQMATERGVTLRTLDDVATFLRGEDGKPQTLDDLEQRIAEEEGLRSEGMTGGALAEEARQALDAALGERSAAWAAVRDAKGALEGVRKRISRTEIKADEAGRALSANEKRMEALSGKAIDLSVRRQILEAAIENQKAEADALRAKIEDVVSAWNGDSSKGAKRSLDKRRTATEGMPADAPRLRTADTAVDDAFKKILKAETGLTPAELAKRAEETWLRVVGTPVGRFSYDDNGPVGAGSGMGKEELGRSFQERKFAMPFDVKSKWLEKDIQHVARSMIEQMNMDMAVIERFGGITQSGGMKVIDATPTEMFKEIYEEMHRQADAFPDIYQEKHGKPPTQAMIDAENIRLRARADQDVQSLQNMLDRQRGMFGVPSDPHGLPHQAARIARNANILTSLGSVVVSAMSDLATPLMRHAVGDLLGSGWVPYVTMTGKEIRGRAVNELKMMGVGLELELGTRLDTLNDVLDNFGRGSKLERFMSASVAKFMTATGLPQWTDVGERVVGYTVMTKVLKAAKAASEEGASKKQISMLADLGIDDDTARRIWSEFSADGGGEKFKGLWLTDTGAWKDKGAAQAMSIAVGRGVERSIVRPGQERPFWTQSNEVGRLMFQFQSFMTATSQTVVLAGLQQRDARVIMGVAAMVGLGALSYQTRQVLQGREPSSDPMKLVVEGMSASGILGWLEQVNTMSEKATGGRVGMSALTGELTSKHVNFSLLGSVGGPVLGKAEDLFTAAQNMAKGQGSGYDIARFRRSLVPGQNFWLLRGAFDNLEDGLARSMGMKPRKRTLRVGAP